MTDIIKEVEQLLDNMREPGFILTRKLVNEAKRLKVESEKSEKIEHFATKTIEKQSAEIEKKDIEIDILIRKKEALKDEVSELRAEVERLTKEIEVKDSIYQRNTGLREKRIFDLMDELKTAKSEAIKEFAERYEKAVLPLLTSVTLDKKDGIHACLDILKEMVGDDNG